MTLILTILLLFFLYVIFVPLFRVLWAAYRMRKEMRNLYNAMRGEGSGTSNGREDEEQPRAEKKIDPNVGEYVEFEELAAETPSEEAGDKSREDYRREEQVEDAEWEEIN